MITEGEAGGNAGAHPPAAAKKMSPFAIPILIIFVLIAIAVGAAYAYGERRPIEWLLDVIYDTMFHFGIIALVGFWAYSKIQKNNAGGEALH